MGGATPLEQAPDVQQQPSLGISSIQQELSALAQQLTGLASESSERAARLQGLATQLNTRAQLVQQLAGAGNELSNEMPEIIFVCRSTAYAM